MLRNISERIPLVFPVHPRTRKKMQEHNILDSEALTAKLKLPEPLNYVRFMNLVFNCRLAITDSGGLQEETSYLGIPCLTIRKNTERPVTITHGTNQLCDLEDVVTRTEELLLMTMSGPKQIELWDGRTAERIVGILREMHSVDETSRILQDERRYA
jgi:UDP-N-acetylglucosamine 2-epimerase (non-hydrolysing)